ncbi:MAG: flagellar GTP-binding protein [Armatimonadota bacterium]|nr:flagellar GTP-binding protein [Armatimonadota bacterium]
MKVRRYVAATMQEALSQVRADLGPDAVILYSRAVPRRGLLGLFGRSDVEVIASVDIAPLPRRKAKPGEVRSEPRGFRREGLEDVRRMVATLAPDGASELDPGELSPEVLDLLRASQEDFSVLSSREALRRLERRITRLISVQPIRLNQSRPRVVALVGPTGVGKTTTIAKLAAHYSVKHGRRVGLITTDTYRIGAAEQLTTYAEIMHLPVEVVRSAADAARVMERYRQLDLVLVDTPGRSPRQVGHLEELSGILQALAPQEIHLVLSLATRDRDLRLAADRFRLLGYNRLLLTKLDECAFPALVLHVASRSPEPLSYVTYGQGVPDDLACASPRRLAALIAPMLRTHPIKFSQQDFHREPNPVKA